MKLTSIDLSKINETNIRDWQCVQLDINYPTAIRTGTDVTWTSRLTFAISKSWKLISVIANISNLL